jgi:serine/threonine-protein kinase
MSDLRAAVVDALGPLYRVEREVRPIGEYRLFVVTMMPDGPELLVKVLPAAVSFAIDGQKFERELLLLADQLHHPNLVAPKGGGRAGKSIYHARPFIQGTTLRAWMERNGQLPLTRALEVILGVLGGLAHAHAAGIAHGDLRAEHVILGTGGVVLADTGITRVLGHTASARRDMDAFAALVLEMLTTPVDRAADEALDRTRTLPPWLTDWLQTRWTDAGTALAALRPPPARSSFGPHAPQALL